MAHKLLQDENGMLYLAKEVEQLAVEEVQRLYEHLKSDLALAESFLAKKLNPQPADQPAAADSAAQVDAPADPNQPPADPNAQPAPVEQAAPAADPNAQPAPALDANGNPVQPAQDPGQPQPEQPVMPPLQ